MLDSSVENGLNTRAISTVQPNSAPEIPSNRHLPRKLYTVLCEAYITPRKGKKMDKPKPLQNKVVPSEVSNHPKDAKQNVFAMASHSAQLLAQQRMKQMTVLANFGVYMKSREMRCTGVTYKPNGNREVARRLRQQAKKQA